MSSATLEAPMATQSWASDIQNVFDAQKANQYIIGSTTASERKAKLKKLIARLNGRMEELKLREKIESQSSFVSGGIVKIV